MRKELLIIGLLLSVLLVSCATSSAKYVQGIQGYAVTKGDVITVRNLSSDSNQDFSDGVAIKISQGGGAVTMKLGASTETIELVPDAILIYSGDADYLLKPYGAEGTDKGGEPEKKPAAAQ